MQSSCNFFPMRFLYLNYFTSSQIFSGISNNNISIINKGGNFCTDIRKQ